MNVEELKSRILRKIYEYCDYSIGWGDHKDHCVRVLDMGHIIADYPKFKIQLHCRECDEIFTEIWGIN